MIKTLSIPAVKPKVYKVPSPNLKPVALSGSFRPLFAACKNHRRTLCTALASLTVFALLLGHAFTTSAAIDKMPTLAEQKLALFAPADSQAATLEQPFVLNDENQEIVGQITKIPEENKEIYGIKAPPVVDNKANHDLLSVVNKH